MSLVIGLTGGIGSGKSAVADAFAALGADVTDTDRLAHALTEPGCPGHRAILQHFGADFARPDGSLALELEGRAHGRILLAPRGQHDFGYDPWFEFTEPGHDQTGRGFAELEADEKGEVSHRGRALLELSKKIPGLLREA